MSSAVTRPALMRLPVLALLLAIVAGLGVGWCTNKPVAAENPKLNELMGEIADNSKIIADSLADPGADAVVLQAAAAMQARLLAAKAEQPSNLSELDPLLRAAHAAAFRADMARALIKVLELEIAVLEARRDDAVRIVKDDLRQLSGDAHEKYEATRED